MNNLLRYYYFIIDLMCVVCMPILGVREAVKKIGDCANEDG